uniref:Uncharacterized protein n=1 Tax=Angiostrongylus cantonensis TaxID=6313 RepID=A0A0K0DIR6_ANGCA
MYADYQSIVTEYWTSKCESYVSTKQTRQDVGQLEEVRDEGAPLCSAFGGPALQENSEWFPFNGLPPHWG